MRETERGSSNIRGIVRSGVPALDDWLGGVRAHGSHLVTGGSGTGKSTLAWLFADAGLRHGESVTMLVHGRVEHLKAHARALGVDVDAALRDGRLLLLRYRSDFVRRLSHAASPEHVVDDLTRVIGTHTPSRFVIDTIAPFLTGPAPRTQTMSALMAMIEHSRATALLTFAEDLSATYDRNLEPLVQGSAAVIRLVHEDAHVRGAEIVNLRYPPPSTPTTHFGLREPGERSERMPFRVP